MPLGRGGVCYSISTGGQWSEDESKHRIDYFECLACFLTLRAFCLDIQNSHLKAMIDNTTAISYINSIGGRSVLCNGISRELVLWCAKHNIQYMGHTAIHIPGKQNVLADKESRVKKSDFEWKLNPLIPNCLNPYHFFGESL